MSRYATTDELAARYRVTAETIRAWARQGKIPSLRFGQRPLLFDVAEVDQCLRSADDEVGSVHDSCADPASAADGNQPGLREM